MKTIGLVGIAMATVLTLAIVQCGGKTVEADETNVTAHGGSGSGTGTGTGTSLYPTPPVIAPRVPTAHRATATSCAGVYSAPEPPSGIDAATNGCTRHSDCDEGMNGKCITGNGYMGRYYRCAYDNCTTDADCGSGTLCYCTTSSAAWCTYEGNCRVDADCGGGLYSYCSPAMGSDCGGSHSVSGYYCHTPQDSCIDDSDCKGTDYCNFDEYKASWQCTPINNMCAIG